MTLGWFHRREAEYEEAAAMPKRKRSGALLLACPLVLTCCIGIYSRSYNDDFVVPTGTPAQDAVAYAYVPYVKDTKHVFRTETPIRSELLDLAERWDQAARAGKLQPVIPVSFEDSPEVGARSSINRAKSTLVAGLLDDAITQTRDQKYSEAARSAILGIRISESYKYSDFNAVYQSSVEQRRAEDILARMIPHLDSSDKVAVRDSLNLIKANSQELATLTKFSRIQYYDYLRRVSKEPVSIEDVHRAVLVSKRIESDPTSKDTLRYVRSSMMQNSSDNGTEYLTELRMAWAGETSNQAKAKRLIDSF